MEKTTPVVIRKKLNQDELVNTSTGEVIQKAIESGETVMMHKETNKFIMDYSDYPLFSSGSILAMPKLMNKSDMANILLMSANVRKSLNIVSNKKKPHDNESLQEFLDIASKAMYFKFIKRMVECNVLCKEKGIVGGHRRTIYLMNPYLCRKRKIFDKKLLEVFRKFDGS